MVEEMVKYILFTLGFIFWVVLLTACSSENIFVRDNAVTVIDIRGNSHTLTGNAKNSFLEALEKRGIYPSDKLWFFCSIDKGGEAPPSPSDEILDSTAMVIDIPKHFVILVSNSSEAKKQFSKKTSGSDLDTMIKDVQLPFSWDIGFTLNLEKDRILSVTTQW